MRGQKKWWEGRFWKNFGHLPWSDSKKQMTYSYSGESIDVESIRRTLKVLTLIPKWGFVPSPPMVIFEGLFISQNLLLMFTIPQLSCFHYWYSLQLYHWNNKIIWHQNLNCRHILMYRLFLKLSSAISTKNIDFLVSTSVFFFSRRWSWWNFV